MAYIATCVNYKYLYTEEVDGEEPYQVILMDVICDDFSDLPDADSTQWDYSEIASFPRSYKRVKAAQGSVVYDRGAGKTYMADINGEFQEIGG